MAAALAAGALACFWATPALARSVTVVVLPQGTTVRELAGAGLSPGVMSAGIGQVPAEQTYLDTSQGNRIDDALYDQRPPPLPSFWTRVPHWTQIVQRADGAPADIAPGLLASTLLAQGIRSEAVPAAESAALVVAERDGKVGRENFGMVTVISAGVGEARKLTTGMPGGDLLIAFAAPPPASHGTLAIGIAGRGFGGDLTSDSTRTDGYVLSTDIAPTILQRLGVAIPKEMDGEPIRAEGPIDPASVHDRAERMTAIADRRIPVVVGCLAAWLAIALMIGLLAPTLRRTAAAWLGVTIGFLPAVLLVGAAVQPGAFVEGLITGLGAAALAAITLALARGWWAAAIACAISTLAYAIDVIAGSPLTTLSLLGPNPIFGVRFYGIGNELEALIAVMVPVAVGAALSAASVRGRSPSPRVAVGSFLIAGGLAALVFAAGRFGADVGAAVVLPVGAAVAAALIGWSGEGLGRRVVLAVIAAPAIALAALALVDLVSGGNAHLTRSVLDAGGAGDLADIAQRRLTLSANDFTQAAGDPLFWVVVLGIAVGLAKWRRIDAWLELFPAARAGVIGACAAVAVGVLVNDSGASFLVLGSIALGATIAFAWAQASTNP